MSRQSTENKVHNFRYPFRQNQSLQVYQEENRSKSINKLTSLHNTFCQNFKIDIRAITPQKNIYHPHTATNNSLKNFSYTHNGRLQNMSFNVREDNPKTADNFYRSPQHKNTHHSHSANISINFEPFKSPLILADESYKYQ